ncbi:MAG: tetratricopeptide repeat protein [Gemmataceae bacterium]|nr:tetratricopeptide repeat protein [Gemmataceae bacterium]
MPDQASSLPSPTPEQRHTAAQQYDRAAAALARGGHDYALTLLVTCCRLDPANLLYRKALRKAQRKAHEHRQGKGRFGFLGAAADRLALAAARQRLRKAVRTGDHRLTLERAEEVLNRDPSDAAAHTALAETFLAVNLLDQAVWALEQALDREPPDPVVARTLARLYERRGNFKQAAGLGRQLRDANPADDEAARKLRELAASDAIRRAGYQEALRGDQDWKRAAVETDTGLEVEGQAPPAPSPDEVDALRARLETNPADAAAYLQLARLHRVAGNFEHARQVLARGLAAVGNRFELAVELADAEIDPFRENLAVAEEQLRERPDDPELHRIRVRLLKEINTRELYLYRQKADRFPADPVHRYELGLRLLRAGQIDEAVEELLAARTDVRFAWRAPAYLGFCFKERGPWPKAEAFFQEALHALPADEGELRKELLFQLATGAAAVGDVAKALSRGHALARLDPAYGEVGRLVEEWHRRLEPSEDEGAQGG